MQKGDTTAAAELRDLSLAVVKLNPQGAEGVFWILCSGFFEAVASGSLPVDLYVKRAASQVLMQFAAGPRGERHVSERMAKELLFFCAQALPETGPKTRHLEAVRKAYDLGRFVPVDYESRRYGRFDPAVVAQARKRIEAVKEAWSALAGGDVVRLKNIADQFGLVADSIIKLHPRSERLAGGLKHAAEVTQRSGKAPAAEVALEVATAVLYLEAALTDRNQDERELAQRTDRLAERLEQVCGGNSAEPLEAWMEELYRRVSDRQTMGTVVGELRATLSEAEKALDQFFRNPDDTTALTPVPGLLAQMRGVLSVLGLDQASQAVVSMRDNVEEMLVTKVDVELAPMAGTFDRLGNNLGALGLLIDMLNYQPALAKKLFVFDPELGELRPVMGRATTNGTIGLPASDHPVLPVSQETTRDGQGAASQFLGDASAASLGPDWALDLALPGPIPDEVRELARQEVGSVEGVLNRQIADGYSLAGHRGRCREGQGCSKKKVIHGSKSRLKVGKDFGRRCAVGELTQPRAIRADEIEAGTVRHRVPVLRSGIGLPLIEDLEACGRSLRFGLAAGQAEDRWMEGFGVISQPKPSVPFWIDRDENWLRRSCVRSKVIHDLRDFG